jgi:hypothetical protein
MSRLTRIASLALFLAVTGCATLRPTPPEQNAEIRLAQGAAAFDAERYHEAFDHFAWVYARCSGREAALEAAVAMAALELDPRHPTGRPQVGMELLAQLVLDPTTPPWLRQIARTTYLLGLGLGAAPVANPTGPTGVVGDGGTGRTTAAAGLGAPAAGAAAALRPSGVGGDRTVGCGRVLREEGPAPTELPALPGPSLAAMLAETEADRAAQAAQAATLLEELNRLRRELTETRAELERIRRTLRP